MGDIDAYEHHRKYLAHQMTRVDYAVAIPKILELARKHSKDEEEIYLADFGCGVGNITRAFSKETKVKRALLIDHNEGFIDRAEETIKDVDQLILKKKNILEVELKKDSNLIFSIFMYHHAPHKDKAKYVSQIKKALKKGGKLILGEIYFNSKEDELLYYDALYKAIPAFKKSPELQKFINQTAKSKKSEFKTSKKFTEELFAKKGFRLLEETKVWPKDNSDDEGMFIQVYTL